MCERKQSVEFGPIPQRDTIHIIGIFDGQVFCARFFIVSFCQVDRYKKILKENKDVKFAGMYYNFEIFHMLEKQIPVDSVEVSLCYCNFAESEEL
jgi:hypothetical protein